LLHHHRAHPTLPSRTVLLGANGFVAAAIRRRLAQRGAEVLVRSAREHDLLRPGAAEDLATALRADDALVVVAAEAPCRSPEQLVRNVRLVEAVCAALVKQPVDHVVYISSDAVYADGAGPITEATCPTAPDLHGAMHRAREVMLGARAGAALAILRLSLLYGAADPHNGYGPNRFRRTAAESGRIQLFGEGEEKRDHVWIDDLAEIAVRVLERRSAGILNVATGTSSSFREVAERVAALFDSVVEITGQPRKTPITHRHFDAIAVRKAFPDFRFTPLADGLERVHREITHG